MTASSRICLYCSKALLGDDRVAACDLCFSAHHEECWNRNGRCSTFRCLGAPRTMKVADLPAVMTAALEVGNSEPRNCPFCASRVYPGILHSPAIRVKDESLHGPATGLMFVGKGKPNPHKDWFGKNFLAKMLGNKSWFLPGAHVRSRSCGKCHRLFLWGTDADEITVVTEGEEVGERLCPHCAEPLWIGAIVVGNSQHGGARFECEQIPDFHSDWFGHQILDRYVFNRWNPATKNIPARSCQTCHFTEIGGKPIYRFT